MQSLHWDLNMLISQRLAAFVEVRWMMVNVEMGMQNQLGALPSMRLGLFLSQQKDDCVKGEIHRNLHLMPYESSKRWKFDTTWVWTCGNHWGIQHTLFCWIHQYTFPEWLNWIHWLPSSQFVLIGHDRPFFAAKSRRIKGKQYPHRCPISYAQSLVWCQFPISNAKKVLFSLEIVPNACVLKSCLAPFGVGETHHVWLADALAPRWSLNRRDSAAQTLGFQLFAYPGAGQVSYIYIHIHIYTYIYIYNIYVYTQHKYIYIYVYIHMYTQYIYIQYIYNVM